MSRRFKVLTTTEYRERRAAEAGLSVEEFLARERAVAVLAVWKQPAEDHHRRERAEMMQPTGLAGKTGDD